MMLRGLAALRLFALLALAGLAFAQRADRATISGLVTDPSGTLIAGATVKIRSQDTNVETVLETNESGAYSSPLLVLGTYTVTVERSGFKTGVRSDIQLLGGQTYRVDMRLELGTVTERIEVSAAAEMVNTTQPDVSHTVGEEFYRDLPVVMGADIRLAEAMLQLQPGYTPMRPNGDPMFRGSQFSSRINGGQTFATENFFDGVAFGYASGHQDSHESSPPVESIGEMRVIGASYSAQYGHTSGGTVEYTSKVGTKEFHGSLYEYLANDALNARGFFPVDTPKARNNQFGFTLGGPAYIPKLYDGRNKTFFFFNLDYLKFRSGPLPGFGNTTPIDAFKRGDFSALLTGAQVGTDVLGRPVFSGQIFNPASTRLVNGIPVRDPYQGNIIPANDPLRSQVAAKIVPLQPAPWRGGLSNNVGGNPSGDQTWIGDFRTILFRVDHNINDRFKSATSFFWPARPSIRNCGEVLGCTPEFNPEKYKDYIGNGFQQRIATHHATQQFDYIIRNNLLFHSTTSWDRWFMGGQPLSAGLNWPDRLWGADKSGIIDKTAGPPNFTFTAGQVPYTQLGMQWIGTGFEAINRWQFVNDLTWVKGKHSVKMGYEYRLHQFNFHGWAASTGGSFNFNRITTGGYDARGNSLSATGDPYASFLLGQVQTANYQIPVFTTWNGGVHAAFINDDFKVTGKLTLTLGLRFDYQTPFSERWNRFSNFDPTAPNPGAGNVPGAIVFATPDHPTFDQPPKDAWGPRFGFAYQLRSRTVLRGGYGIYYGGVAFSNGPTPITGFFTNPTAPNLTNGLYPAFYLDDGFPRERIIRPPNLTPSVANGTSPIGQPAKGNTLPRYQNWSFTVQHQLSNSMLLDLAYLGNHGTRLPYNGAYLGLPQNMNDPSILGLGTPVLQADINSDLAKGAGIKVPYSGFAGIVAQALRPWPQYQGINWHTWPIGKSIYHSFQAKLDKRFTEGVLFRVFWVKSKLLNNGADNGYNNSSSGLQNPIDARPEWSTSADDVPNTFVATWSYELPFARSRKNDLIRKLTAGWTLNGILRYESGRPLNVTMTNDMAGLLFNNVKRPNRVAGVDALTPAASGHFDPNAQFYFDRSAWTDPGPLKFGNAPPRDPHVRGFPNYVEDVSIFKETQFGERFRWRLEVQGGNFINRTKFCEPNTNWSATPVPAVGASAPSGFGVVNTQCNTPRSIQLGTKLTF